MPRVGPGDTVGRVYCSVYSKCIAKSVCKRMRVIDYDRYALRVTVYYVITICII